MQSLYPYLICKQLYNSSLSQLLFFIFSTTYCYYFVVQLVMLISHQILLYCASIILITPYQSMNPYIYIYICSLFIFIDSFGSFLVTLVFLNDYSIIQIKFISCGPAVLLKGSHCISLILLNIYSPLQMSPYLIITVIINIVYQCFLLFSATTPTWVVS